MKKLVLFGDSLFAQVGKDRLLAMEGKLDGYDVYNCAVGGWNTNDCVKKSTYIAGLKPDVVVISLGTNDAAPWKQVDIESFKNNIPKIFSSFSDSRVIYFLPPPVNEEKVKIKYEMGLPNSVLQEYHDAVKVICQENNVEFIDSFEVFGVLCDKGTDYHVDDGVHFIDLAYDVISDELARILK